MLVLYRYDEDRIASSSFPSTTLAQRRHQSLLVVRELSGSLGRVATSE